jgi:RNA polymerase sigma factor (sigma-70 family)
LGSQDETKKRDQALAQVVKEHEGPLRALIRSRVKDQTEAQDVLQDVFEEYIGAYDLGVAVETLGAWLVRVAQNKIIDRFRRQRSREAKPLESGEAKDPATPESEALRAVLRREIADALELLPPEQLWVFVGHELEGKSFQQLVEESGMNVNTLLARKRYAVQFLREYLKEVYDELE